MAAVEVEGNEEVIEFLLGLGARPGQCEVWGDTESALHAAVDAAYIRRFAQCDNISMTDLSNDRTPLHNVRTLAKLRAFKCFHDAAFKRDCSPSTFSKSSCHQSWCSILNIQSRIRWEIDEFDTPFFSPLVINISAHGEVACLRAVLAWTRCTAPRTENYWNELRREALRVAGRRQWDRFVLLSAMGGADVCAVNRWGVSSASLAARTQGGRNALAKLGVVAKPNKRRPGWRLHIDHFWHSEAREMPNYCFVRARPAPFQFDPVDEEGEHPRRQCRSKCRRSASKQAALRLQHQRRLAGKVRSKQRRERPVRV